MLEIRVLSLTLMKAVDVPPKVKDTGPSEHICVSFQLLVGHLVGRLTINYNRTRGETAHLEEKLGSLIVRLPRNLPAEGNGYTLKYSCLQNSMDRGAWWAPVHGVTKSLSN